MHRPVWIDTREPAAATPVLASVITRLLAAAPDSHTRINVIDLADALGPLTGYLQAHMTQPAISAHTDVDKRLQYLVTLAELAVLQDDPGTTAPAGGVVVITDPGYGLPPDAIQATAQLICNSRRTAISVLFVGDHADATASPIPLLRDIAEYSHHIRLDATVSGMLDPWTQNAWRFVPETLVPGPRLADLIDTVTPPWPNPTGEQPW